MKPMCETCPHKKVYRPEEMISFALNFKTSLGLIHYCHERLNSPCVGHIEDRSTQLGYPVGSLTPPNSPSIINEQS